METVVEIGWSCDECGDEIDHAGLCDECKQIAADASNDDTCGTCGGCGEGRNEYVRCHSCGGKGFVVERRAA